jgi:hypothetical protein
MQARFFASLGMTYFQDFLSHPPIFKMMFRCPEKTERTDFMSIRRAKGPGGGSPEYAKKGVVLGIVDQKEEANRVGFKDKTTQVIVCR